MLKTTTTALLLLLALPVAAQVAPAQFDAMRNETHGDIRFKKKGIMDGNLVRTLYFNWGEVAEWPNQPSGEWPRGSGHSYLDGVAVLVGSQFQHGGRTIRSVPTAYREWMDQDPVTGDLWGFMPVPGYTSDGSEIPALSNQPLSWPATWPTALGLEPRWDGFWYGYFGRGVMNADLETFFVMDDAKDAEFSLPPFNYTPIASNDRLGLGLRVEVRGFQWSHVLAEDNIFWHYDIVNLADQDYPEMAFGFYTDVGVGGTNDSGDDRAFYDVDLDIAYAFDGDGIGTPGGWQPVGYIGYAYLESPGDPTNGVDDDGDGLVDERRDDGLDNDGDWDAFSDLNGNGTWDPADEPLNDDLGVDGVGPFDLQYNGPDEGEGDGLPTAGEPDFDATDIDESDQIGLQSLAIYRLVDGGGGTGWPRNDDAMWDRLTARVFDTDLQRANISMVFGAGPFLLPRATRQRFSMSLLFGSDLDDLAFNKETVQEIYDANYNFAQPPLKPYLTAVPGDGKVVLYWDDRSEGSFDRFLQEFDFEGYLVYRSEEAEFNDIKIITDSKGSPKYWKPIAQFDLVNGVKGPDPIGINGAHFWRGDDTGLQHAFVDTTVTNGVQYYYAIVAYDKGDPERGTKGLTPAENTKIIREDFSGNVLFTDINTAVVVPNAPAAGYRAPQVQDATVAGAGTGEIGVTVLDPQTVEAGGTYRLTFHAEGDMPNYRTSSYDIARVDGGTETVLFEDVPFQNDQVEASPPFAGLIVTVANDTLISVDQENSGWLAGGGFDLTVGYHSRVASRSAPWPADYELQFHDSDVYTTPFTGVPAPITVMNLSTGKQVDFEVLDAQGRRGSLAVGDPLTIIEYLRDANGDPIRSQYRFAWDVTPPGSWLGAGAPSGGDRYQFRTTKPFAEGDTFTFSTTAASVDAELAADELKDIAVVPNPYIGAASWERRTLNQTGRGERRINFINLPQRCTIRIYTTAGALIKTIEHDTGALNGAEAWNLISDDGMEIAYGVYIYHVDAPDIGERIGKFAVVK